MHPARPREGEPPGEQGSPHPARQEPRPPASRAAGHLTAYRHRRDSITFTVTNRNTAVPARKKIELPRSMMPLLKSLYRFIPPQSATDRQNPPSVMLLAATHGM